MLNPSISLSKLSIKVFYDTTYYTAVHNLLITKLAIFKCNFATIAFKFVPREKFITSAEYILSPIHFKTMLDNWSHCLDIHIWKLTLGGVSYRYHRTIFISIQISVEYFPEGPMESSSVQVMAVCRTGEKPLPEARGWGVGVKNTCELINLINSS